jgi:hypothetical protein
MTCGKGIQQIAETLLGDQPPYRAQYWRIALRQTQPCPGLLAGEQVSAKRLRIERTSQRGDRHLQIAGQ